jgi:hypothetical protein
MMQHENVKPCLACEYSSNHDSECVHKDSMSTLNEKLIDTDLVVFLISHYYCHGSDFYLYLIGMLNWGSFNEHKADLE